MPDLLEHTYCAQQINIPPNLPFILKQYAKAAIRTQPHDLLFWSAAYFRAKANNLPPPVKERLEYPPFDSPSRLSPGFLKVLHKQLGSNEYVRVEVLYDKWLGVCLVKESLESMLKLGDNASRVLWLQFVAIAAGHICKSLSKTMVLICEVLTDQPEGAAAWIPVEKFVDLYKFLAALNCGPDPPAPKRVEILLESPSETNNTVSSATAEDKAEPEQKEQVEEKDSTAGLMVWQDIKPESKPDRFQSPRPEDEPGASSEVGVEVYDDAKGPVTELVTLFPITSKSQVSQKSSSPERLVEEANNATMDGNILSHSSLKENDNWVEIEPRKFDDDVPVLEQPLDLDALMAEKSARTQTQSPGESEIKIDEDSETEKEEKTPEDQEATDDSLKEPSEKAKTTSNIEDTQGKTTSNIEDNRSKTSSKIEDTQIKTTSNIEDNRSKTSSKIEETQIKTTSNIEDNRSKTASKIEDTQIKTTSNIEDNRSKTASNNEDARSKTTSNTEDTHSKATSNIEDTRSKTDSNKTEKKHQTVVETKPQTFVEKGKSEGDESKEHVTIRGTTVQSPAAEDSDENSAKNITRHKTDSEIAVDQTITMANFIKEPETNHSVFEIRKGRIGEQSLDQIDSSNSPTAAPTMHRLLAASEDSLEVSEKEERSNWAYVPGIGPVIPEDQVQAVVDYMRYWATKQGGMVGPRNINHILCPPLDLPSNTEEESLEAFDYTNY